MTKQELSDLFKVVSTIASRSGESADAGYFIRVGPTVQDPTTLAFFKPVYVNGEKVYQVEEPDTVEEIRT